jgi:hypothetical protein
VIQRPGEDSTEEREILPIHRESDYKDLKLIQKNIAKK